MADATITIGGDASALKQQLREAGASIRTFGDNAKKSFSALDLGKVLGLAGGIAGLTKLVSVGFQFNQTMQDGQIAIANVLKSFKGLSDEAAKREAAKAVQLIAQAEPKAAGGLQELTQGFIASAAAAAGAGLTVEQNVDLVARFANALSNAGLPLDQLNQEIRSILTANVTSDSFIGKLLEGKGMSNARIQQLIQEGNLYDELVTQLGALGEAGDTAAVAFSSLESSMKKALGAATEGLFGQSAEGAKDLSKAIEGNLEGFRNFGQAIAGLSAFAATSFNFIIGKLDEVGEGAADAARKLMGMQSHLTSEVTGSVSGVMGGAAAGALGRVAGKTLGGEKDEGAKGKKWEQSAESVLSLQRQIEAVEKMRERLGEREFERVLKSMTPQLQIAALKKRMAQEEERQKQQQEEVQGPLNEDQLIENRNRMMDLEEKLRQAVEQRGEAEKEAAEKAKSAAEDAAEQKENVLDLDREIALLAARASGDDRQVKKLEREGAIERNKQRIMEETGASEEDALKKARMMQDLKEKAEERENRGGPGRRGGGTIQGYSFEEQGGREDKASYQSGLDEMGKKKGRPLNKEFKFPGLDSLAKLQQREQNPGEVMAKKNAAAAAEPAKGLEGKIDKMISILEQGLLGE